MTVNTTTLAALREFPAQLKAHFEAIPPAYQHWAPPSWDGVPSEAFTALEQVCHVRDIEIDGYHLRFHRALNEPSPTLAPIDSEALAQERRYGGQDAAQALRDFQNARERTVALLATLTPEQLRRTAMFEGYGSLTVRSLVHYLCSHDQQHLAGMQWLAGKIFAMPEDWH